MGPFENHFFVRRPPHQLDASTEATHSNRVSTSGAGALAAVDLLGSDQLISYVVMRFSADGFIAFSEFNTVAAETEDFPVKAGEIWEWLCCGNRDRYFSIIRAGATDVQCDYYLSDRLVP